MPGLLQVRPQLSGESDKSRGRLCVGRAGVVHRLRPLRRGLSEWREKSARRSGQRTAIAGVEKVGVRFARTVVRHRISRRETSADYWRAEETRLCRRVGNGAGCAAGFGAGGGVTAKKSRTRAGVISLSDGGGVSAKAPRERRGTAHG